MLSFEEIKELIQLINHSSLQRFELEQEASKIVIVKGENSKANLIVPQAEIIETKVQDRGTAVKPSAEEQKISNLMPILSPMVGTFYAAPEPGAEPFVKIGQKVEAETIVCVLEAMKLFHELEADMSGEIAQVLVKDGEFVEYGQKLFLVKG